MQTQLRNLFYHIGMAMHHLFVCQPTLKEKNKEEEIQLFDFFPQFECKALSWKPPLTHEHDYQVYLG